MNHLSHFLLILELLPIMLDTASTTGDGRIVIVSSSAHENRIFDPENLEGDRSYADLEFYGRSKLYNVIFVADVFIAILIFAFILWPGDDSICSAEKTKECRHHCLCCSPWFCELAFYHCMQSWTLTFVVFRCKATCYQKLWRHLAQLKRFFTKGYLLCSVVSTEELNFS